MERQFHFSVLGGRSDERKRGLGVEINRFYIKVL